MKKKLVLFLLAVTTLSMLSACGRPRKVPTIDMDCAQLQLQNYCMSFPAADRTENTYCVDLNGDGSEELCMCVAINSTLPHKAIVVYDVYNDKYYTLDGEYYSYDIERTAKRRLIVMCGEDTHGSVTVQDGELVFTADKVKGRSN